MLKDKGTKEPLRFGKRDPERDCRKLGLLRGRRILSRPGGSFRDREAPLPFERFVYRAREESQTRKTC